MTSIQLMQLINRQLTISLVVVLATLLMISLDRQIMIASQSSTCEDRYIGCDCNQSGVATLNLDKQALSSALRSLQRSMKINETGILDESTRDLMKVVPCNRLDNPYNLEKVGERLKAASEAAQIGHSNVTLFSYKVSRYPEKLLNRRDEIDTLVKRAFAAWSKAAAIDFEPKLDGRVDFDIEFSQNRDLKNEPSDLSRDQKVHIEDRGNFTINTGGPGEDIYYAIVHELGHALGLEHSSIRWSVMSPINEYRPNLELHRTDVAAVQELYGKRV